MHRRAGRPKGEAATVVNVRIPLSLVERLDRYLDNNKRDVLNGFGVVYDGASLVDFDDCLVGPPVQDLWLLARGHSEEARKLREDLLEGYEAAGGGRLDPEDVRGVGDHRLQPARRERGHRHMVFLVGRSRQRIDTARRGQRLVF